MGEVLPRVKPGADFDWTHPRKIDRDAVEALFDLDFLREHINVVFIVFIGSGGVGKTMLAQNLSVAGARLTDERRDGTPIMAELDRSMCGASNSAAVKSRWRSASRETPTHCHSFAKTWGKAGQWGASRSKLTLSNRPNSRECGRSVGCGAV